VTSPVPAQIHPAAEWPRLECVYRRLDTMHAWRGWHWWPDADPFEVAIGAILVQNTSWTNVERALESLRSAGALTPAAMAALNQDELEALVRPSGQYRQKARKLRSFLDLIAAHGSIDALLSLPADELRAKLLATWGIGPETADGIILFAARQSVFPIDAYTLRVFGRLGIGPVETTSYDQWQQYFDECVPPDRDLRARFRALIVLHAKHLCRKRDPRCGDCALRPECPGARP
jgi:endonuclease III related protein